MGYADAAGQPALIAVDHDHDYERALIARAGHSAPLPCWRDLNQARLAEIARREGIDFATALLYCALRQSSDHGPAIAALDGEAAVSRRGSPSAQWRPFVAIVPGGCHEESADSRAALQMVHAEVLRQGLPTGIAPVRSFGLLPEQAAIIAEWLDARREPEVIVVSLSKGTAEVKLALRDHPRSFRAVRAWVNISGLLYGSEWARWLLDRRISHWSARVWCWYWGYPFAALEQLRRAPDSLLDFDVSLPPEMQAVHVIGLPLANRLSHPYTRRSFVRLTPLGPNDGMGIMAGDLVRYSGSIYPVLGADHFLRSRGLNVQALVRRVLCYLADRQPGSSSGDRDAVQPVAAAPEP